jgi:carbamoyltransferase
MIVLGLHGGVTLGQHEPGASLVIDGKVAAICEEERYLRIKSAYGYLPYYSVQACLKMAGIRWEDIDLIVTPGITYDDFETRIRDYLRHSFGSCPRLECIHHQQAHLAAAFYGSGYEDSLVLSLDATGDGSCGMLAEASRADGIKVIETIPTNKSIGYFYTLMTYYLGFVDGDEYKVMGLAPYGKPTVDLSPILRSSETGWEFDWSFVRANPPLRSPFEPSYAAKIVTALGQSPRVPGSAMTDFYTDVAASTQEAFEQGFLGLVNRLRQIGSSSRNLCYAGGVALNCSANGELFRRQVFDNVYVSPVSSDRGLALGCAYHGAVLLGDKPWRLASPYQGSSYSDDVIRKELDSNGIRYVEVDDPAARAAEMLAEEKIIGWYQGRSEAGARALGNRSILAKCESPKMKDKVNARIKYREQFRPFAPATLDDRATEYFQTRGVPFPYMSFTIDSVEAKRDRIASVVHVDGTARLQTVRSSDNELYYEVIRQYADRTGVPVILNTSFNLKGQPIVETPRDAIMTFFGCGLDALILGNYVATKV